MSDNKKPDAAIEWLASWIFEQETIKEKKTYVLFLSPLPNSGLPDWALDLFLHRPYEFIVDRLPDVAIIWLYRLTKWLEK